MEMSIKVNEFQYLFHPPLNRLLQNCVKLDEIVGY